ncbi:hypothetical protein D4Q76_01130 [archaeon]|nr:MAG: hypothetical protein D4Q76_01130 [archaeon]
MGKRGYKLSEILCRLADNNLVDEMLRVRKENGEVMLINSGHVGWIEEHLRKKGYKTNLPYPKDFLKKKGFDMRQLDEVTPNSRMYRGGWGKSFILIE